jgi:hypothetical protein
MADPIFFPACLSQADTRELTNFPSQCWSFGTRGTSLHSSRPPCGCGAHDEAACPIEPLRAKQAAMAAFVHQHKNAQGKQADQ